MTKRPFKPYDHTKPSILDFESSIAVQFGGSVGLCVGFSLLSAVQLVFFFTIRPFLRKRKNWKLYFQEIKYLHGYIYCIWKIGEFHYCILCFRYSHISKLSLAIFIANPCRTSISIDFLMSRFTTLRAKFLFCDKRKNVKKNTRQNNLLEPPFFIDTPSLLIFTWFVIKVQAFLQII